MSPIAHSPAPRLPLSPTSSRPVPRSRLLYVTHRVPCPPNRGDRIRTYHILKYLAARADVSLACFADEPPAPGVIDELRRTCREVAIVPLRPKRRWIGAGLSMLAGGTATRGAFASRDMESLITQMARRKSFDASIASSSALAPYLQLRPMANTAGWIDLIDVDSQKWLDYAAAHRGPKSWLYWLEGRRLRREETNLSDWVAGLFVVSEAEAGLYRSFCPKGPITAIANGVDVDYFAPRDEPERPDCVFVGAMDYLPNVDAAVWFAREVWPEVHRRRPEARFRIVGREPSPAVRELSSIAGVDVVGTVPDVRPALASSAVAVVPLRIARGVQNKVLEAMAMGKAVVCSPPPLNGLPVVPGEHLVRAEEPQEWIDAILRLFDNASERRRLGQAATEYVSKHHRWDTCLQPLGQMLGIEKTRFSD